MGQRGGDVDGRRGLADAALLVGHRHDAGLRRPGERAIAQHDPSPSVLGHLPGQRRLLVAWGSDCATIALTSSVPRETSSGIQAWSSGVQGSAAATARTSAAAARTRSGCASVVRGQWPWPSAIVTTDARGCAAVATDPVPVRPTGPASSPVGGPGGAAGSGQPRPGPGSDCGATTGQPNPGAVVGASLTAHLSVSRSVVRPRIAAGDADLTAGRAAGPDPNLNDGGRVGPVSKRRPREPVHSTPPSRPIASRASASSLLGPTAPSSPAAPRRARPRAGTSRPAGSSAPPPGP